MRNALAATALAVLTAAIVTDQSMTLLFREYPTAMGADIVALPDWARRDYYDVDATSTLSTATPEARVEISVRCSRIASSCSHTDVPPPSVADRFRIRLVDVDPLDRKSEGGVQTGTDAHRSVELDASRCPE